jgi:hypothetical protein
MTWFKLKFLFILPSSPISGNTDMAECAPLKRFGESAVHNLALLGRKRQMRTDADSFATKSG